MGDAATADVDTVQLDVQKLASRGQINTLTLRVNFALQREMRNGEKYQSYESMVEINCDDSSITHVQQTRYVGPFWQGAQTTQRFNDARPMAFGGLQPSPRDKLLKAGCLPHVR